MRVAALVCSPRSVEASAAYLDVTSQGRLRPTRQVFSKKAPVHPRLADGTLHADVEAPASLKAVCAWRSRVSSRGTSSLRGSRALTARGRSDGGYHAWRRQRTEHDAGDLRTLFMGVGFIRFVVRDGSRLPRTAHQANRRRTLTRSDARYEEPGIGPPPAAAIDDTPHVRRLPGGHVLFRRSLGEAGLPPGCVHA